MQRLKPQSRSIRASLAAIVSLFSLSVALADEDELAAVRDEFRSAYERAALGIGLSDEGDSRALHEYAIYDYLTAARLEHRLLVATESTEAVDEDVRRFLDEHGSQPVGFGLRRRWLTSLGRRDSWRTFIDNYEDAVATTELECQYLSARVSLSESRGLERRVAERWLTPGQLPIECETAFQWLRERDVLDADLTARRIRLLLENGQWSFARIIARQLPSDQAAPYLQWSTLLQNPVAEFDKLLAKPELEVLPEALTHAWSAFTRVDPEAALERFDLLLGSRNLRGREASEAARALALGLAWDRRSPEAIEMFNRVSSAHLDDYALEWLARAALWTGAWTLAEQAIAAMSARSRAQPSWRYWAARSAQQNGNSEAATVLFESVIADDNYYSAAAAAHLGVGVRPHLETLTLDRDRMEQMEAVPAFMRARELFRTGLRTEATREWRDAIAHLSDADLVASVHLATDWGWYDVAVATATEQDIFNDYELLYPMPYGQQIDSALELTEIERPLIYGLLRQESLFRDDAVSSAGALGLAQLLPDTARAAANEWSLTLPARVDLLEPEVSIRLGSAWLSTLLEDFEGQLPVALAAYNAGPNAALRWLPERPIAADIWIENIPYNETRAYVRRVLWHSLVYAWLLSDRPQDTSAWLRDVNPLPRSR